jgi:hypothetical protein
MPLSYSSVNNFFTQKQFPKDVPVFLFLSIAIQLILGVFFGHFYDTRIFMATGYLVGSGQNPYISQDLSGIFHNPAFQDMTTIGYPPPWPLLLGLIYWAVHSIHPDFLLYNFAIKIPILFANIGLAFLVAYVLRRLHADDSSIRKAWIFMLLSPFLLYATTAWGQLDSIAALLALSSIVLLDSGKLKVSAVLLALMISIKPIALPLIFIPLLFLKRQPIRQILIYYGLLILCGFLFCVVPFIVFGWDPSPILQNWNAHFTVGGGMSFLVFLEIMRDSYQLPGAWWLLGLIWIPALVLTILVIGRDDIHGLNDLLIKSTVLIMVFFLTRAWLSEPNIILVLPFIVILTFTHELDRRMLAAIWILPFIFSFFNTATAQLFFPSMPVLMGKLLTLMDNFRTDRLIAKLTIVIAWQIAGWWVVFRLIRSISEPEKGITPETQ